MSEVDAAPGAPDAAEPARGGSARVVIAAVVVTLLLVATAFVVGRVTAGGGATTPDTTSTAAGFLRDMQVHHAQAVEMSYIVRDRTDDEDVRRLAYDIATGQGNQAGQMYGLLFSWGLPQYSRAPSMTWMTTPALDGSGHEHEGPAHEPGEPMPGLATEAQLDELRALSGVEAEIRFLELMRAHHVGGVEMVDAIEVRTTNEQVRTMARGMGLSQQAEIDLMDTMLAERR